MPSRQSPRPRSAAIISSTHSSVQAPQESLSQITPKVEHVVTARDSGSASSIRATFWDARDRRDAIRRVGLCAN